MTPGPASYERSATAASVVEPPESVGTRNWPISARSLRTESGRRTRIGRRRSPSENFGVLASMSPAVAMRAT